MTPYVMNLNQVKEYLGIPDITYDDRIKIFLPAVSAAVLNYLNQEYLLEVSGTVTTATATMTGLSENDTARLSPGDIVRGTGFPDDTEAAEILSVDKVNGSIELSIDSTVSGVSEYEFRIVPLGAKPTIAQMVLFRIEGGTVKGAGKQASGGIKSRSYGPLSVGYGDGTAIGSSGFPKALESSLWGYKRPRFA